MRVPPDAPAPPELSVGRLGRVGRRMPAWMGSIRFRLTLVYSLVLFGLAAIVVGGVYWGLARSLDDQPVSQEYVVPLRSFVQGRSVIVQDEVRLAILDVEQLANERALEQLQTYSLGALIALFFASLVVGWVVAGRVLRPIGRITGVAREIQATDLSRRISLDGPDDELRQLADTFDEMLDRLDDAFRTQQRFIQEASHELRNPLAVIRTNLDVTSSDPNATVEDYRQTADLVGRSIERISRVVDDLLAYGRHQNVALRSEPVEIARLVNDMAEEFSGSADTAGVEIATAAPSALWVIGDPDSLRQALANLLANAVRVAPRGSAVRIAAGLEQGWVWLAVSDEGPGIAPEDVERVFQRFERGPNRSADGAGLGLAIVRQTAEAHRGEVRLTSEVGRGSTFTIWLPALMPADPGVDTVEIPLARP